MIKTCSISIISALDENYVLIWRAENTEYWIEINLFKTFFYYKSSGVGVEGTSKQSNN